jgi:flavin reductase (DIM6/NTAB) family NADH-FMN oxidoreductase RutF
MEIDPASLSPRDAYRFLISCVAPRPIAFVTTLSPGGAVNLAPFSFFNGVSSDPPIVSISVSTKRDGSRKDTWANAEQTGEFVVNAVVPELMDAVITSARELPREASELDLTRLARLPSKLVKPPRLADTPVALECRVLRILEIEETGLILGRVAWAHVRDGAWKDGALDPSKVTFVGRMGDDLYCRTTDRFERKREP